MHRDQLSVNMLGVCVRTCVLLLFGAIFIEGAHLLPSLEQAKSYESHVQFTVVDEFDQSQSTTVFLEEYHNLDEKVGRLDFVKSDAREQHFYFLERKVAATIEEPGLICKKQSIKEFVGDKEFNEMSMYDESSGIIGPSASLWKANYTNPEVGEFIIRGIPCKKIIGFDFENDIMLTYYISSSNWMSVHGKKGEAPVRIELRERANRTTAIFDFTFFEVNTTDSMSSTFLVPLHIGCPDLEVSSVQMLTMDDFKIISYAEEVTDLYSKKNLADSITVLKKSWIDEPNRLIKFDTVNKTNSLFVSEILDFNTGVMYQTSNQGRCTIKPIYDAPVFEKNFKGSTGKLKNVSEILMLGLDYNYLGQTMHRNIHCNVFEAIEHDYMYDLNVYKKMVFTYFVMTPEYKSAANQESDQQYVVALVMTGYTKEDETEDMQVERDFFDFRHVDQYPLGSDMNIENCFPEEGSKNYFAIHFSVTDKTRPVIEKDRDQFLAGVKKLVMSVASISFLRLPYMKMYIGLDDVTIVGEMLARPPVLAGFKDEASQGPRESQKEQLNIANPEDCAKKCESLSNCRVFTFCDDGKCYLTPDDTKEDSGPLVTKGSCKNYNRAVIDSNLREAPLEDALKNLFNKVTAEKNFLIKVADDKGVQYEIKANKMEKDIHPNVDKDKKYEQIYEKRHLDPNLHTIVEIEGAVMSEVDCFSKCLNEPSMTCTSFSYCPSLQNCHISDLTLRNLSLKTVDQYMPVNASCNVFRRKALELFSESAGLVPISRGDKKIVGAGGADTCASKCLDEKEFACEGFESCDTQECILHKKHILDVITTEGISPSCKHYFLNYSISLEYISNVLVRDRSTVTFGGMSLDECAKRCFDPTMQCRSINYCPQIADMPSTCEVNTKTITDDGITTAASELCQNYEKRAQDQEPTPDITTPGTITDGTGTGSSDGTTGTGTTDGSLGTTVETIIRERHVRQGVEKGTFTGAVIGMLIFGIIAGALGFLGYSYYRSRRAGDGISVRFTKQT